MDTNQLISQPAIVVDNHICFIHQFENQSYFVVGRMCMMNPYKNEAKNSLFGAIHWSGFIYVFRIYICIEYAVSTYTRARAQQPDLPFPEDEKKNVYI